tara:strand:- start:4474 stop:11229 length:6756 start_codon:yes stop_codon:yes gene_type:complete
MGDVANPVAENGFDVISVATATIQQDVFIDPNSHNATSSFDYGNRHKTVDMLEITGVVIRASDSDDAADNITVTTNGVIFGSPIGAGHLFGPVVRFTPSYQDIVKRINNYKPSELDSDRGTVIGLDGESYDFRYTNNNASIRISDRTIEAYVDFGTNANGQLVSATLRNKGVFDVREGSSSDFISDLMTIEEGVAGFGSFKATDSHYATRYINSLKTEVENLYDDSYLSKFCLARFRVQADLGTSGEAVLQAFPRTENINGSGRVINQTKSLLSVNDRSFKRSFQDPRTLEIYESPENYSFLGYFGNGTETSLLGETLMFFYVGNAEITGSNGQFETGKFFLNHSGTEGNPMSIEDLSAGYNTGYMEFERFTVAYDRFKLYLTNPSYYQLGDPNEFTKNNIKFSFTSDKLEKYNYENVNVQFTNGSEYQNKLSDYSSGSREYYVNRQILGAFSTDAPGSAQAGLGNADIRHEKDFAGWQGNLPVDSEEFSHTHIIQQKEVTKCTPTIKIDKLEDTIAEGENAGTSAPANLTMIVEYGFETATEMSIPPPFQGDGNEFKQLTKGRALPALTGLHDLSVFQISTSGVFLQEVVSGSGVILRGTGTNSEGQKTGQLHYLSAFDACTGGNFASNTDQSNIFKAGHEPKLVDMRQFGFTTDHLGQMFYTINNFEVHQDHDTITGLLPLTGKTLVFKNADGDIILNDSRKHGEASTLNSGSGIFYTKQVGATYDFVAPFVYDPTNDIDIRSSVVVEFGRHVTGKDPRELFNFSFEGGHEVIDAELESGIRTGSFGHLDSAAAAGGNLEYSAGSGFVARPVLEVLLNGNTRTRFNEAFVRTGVLDRAVVPPPHGTHRTNAGTHGNKFFAIHSGAPTGAGGSGSPLYEGSDYKGVGCFAGGAFTGPFTLNNQVFGLNRNTLGVTAAVGGFDLVNQSGSAGLSEQEVDTALTKGASLQDIALSTFNRAQEFSFNGIVTRPYLNTLQIEDLPNPRQLKNIKATDITGVTESILTRFNISGGDLLFPEDSWKDVKRFVRVRKKEFETESILISRDVALSYFTEYIASDFTYPLSSLFGNTIDARQFSDIPARTYDMRLKKILIPSNYFPLDTNGIDKRFINDEKSYGQRKLLRPDEKFALTNLDTIFLKGTDNFEIEFEVRLGVSDNPSKTYDYVGKHEGGNLTFNEARFHTGITEVPGASLLIWDNDQEYAQWHDQFTGHFQAGWIGLADSGVESNTVSIADGRRTGFFFINDGGQTNRLSTGLTGHTDSEGRLSNTVINGRRYEVWADAEPNNAGGTEDVIAVKTDGELNDLSFSSTRTGYYRQIEPHNTTQSGQFIFSTIATGITGQAIESNTNMFCYVTGNRLCFSTGSFSGRASNGEGHATPSIIEEITGAGNQVGTINFHDGNGKTLRGAINVVGTKVEMRLNITGHDYREVFSLQNRPDMVFENGKFIVGAFGTGHNATGLLKKGSEGAYFSELKIRRNGALIHHVDSDPLSGYFYGGGNTGQFIGVTNVRETKPTVGYTAGDRRSVVPFIPVVASTGLVLSNPVPFISEIGIPTGDYLNADGSKPSIQRVAFSGGHALEVTFDRDLLLTDILRPRAFIRVDGVNGGGSAAGTGASVLGSSTPSNKVNGLHRILAIEGTGTSPAHSKIIFFGPNEHGGNLDASVSASALFELSDKSGTQYTDVVTVDTNPNSPSKNVVIDESGFCSKKLINVYEGEFNGSLKTGWSDNPAWILYDMMINPVYGAGGQLDDLQDIDIFKLYSLGRYCDGVDKDGGFSGISDGKGGLEPRFSTNALISNETNAFELIGTLASSFRAIPYWGGSSFNFTVDQPKKPTAIFNNQNVLDGQFNYSDSLRSSRYSRVAVSYQDKDDKFMVKTEYAEDEDRIKKFGLVTNEVEGFGCTSRGQAQRLARYILFGNTVETESVRFTAGQEALVVSPGDIIQIEDELMNFELSYGKVLGLQTGTGAPLGTFPDIGGDSHFVLISSDVKTGIIDTGKGIQLFTTLQQTDYQKLYDIAHDPFKTGLVGPDNDVFSEHIPLRAIENLDRRQLSEFDITGFKASGEHLTKVLLDPKQNDFEFITGVQTGSSFNVSLTNRDQKFYRVTSISEREVNQYQIDAVEFNTGKFTKIEELNFVDTGYGFNIGTPTFELNVPTPPQGFITGTGFLPDGSIQFTGQITGQSDGTEDRYRVSLTTPNQRYIFKEFIKDQSSDPPVTPFNIYNLSAVGTYKVAITAIQNPESPYKLTGSFAIKNTGLN